jgi:hypothetical protein
MKEQDRFPYGSLDIHRLEYNSALYDQLKSAVEQFEKKSEEN